MLNAVVLLLALLQDPAPDPIAKERTSLLRQSLKTHAAFLGPAAGGRVRLRMDKDAEEKEWPVDSDAEIRVNGSWGSVLDLGEGSRVWVWVRVDRDSKPQAVFMIADEISEQDIHQVPPVLSSVDPVLRTVTIRRSLDGKTEEARTLKAPAALAISREGEDLVVGGIRLKPGSKVYVQTAGEEFVRLLPAETLAVLKEAQRARLEDHWRKTGLPGTVTALHRLSGEVELTLDHEAIRWGRALKPGDKVTLNLEKPVAASVLDVRPWYERTRLTLVSIGRELSEVSPGQRIRLAVPVPPPELLQSPIPPDAGRPREPAARAEWMLASTYCGCSIHGDVCTGMFYTLAACNTMTCGMPNQVRKFVRPLIEKGMSDPEIFGLMEKEFGPSIWKPHLLR